MKKNLLLACLFLTALTMNAQFTITDVNGDEYDDGDVISFATFNDAAANFDFFVTNTGDDVIRTRILFESAENADGSGLELCYGLCYTGITIGNVYPPGDDSIDIEPGASTGQGNHIYNAVGGDQVISYVFKFYEVDEAGNEIGESKRLTYEYNPALGTNENSKLDLTLASTVISNYLTVTSAEDLMMNVYDMRGAIVKTTKVGAGRQDVNLSNLSSQVYLVSFKNEAGASKTVKVIKN